MFAAIAGPILGALIGSSASRSAASQSADAATRASELQAGQTAQAREDLAQWRGTGQKADNKLARMLKLDGDGVYSFDSEDPGYAFRLAEGQKQVDNSAAARGSTLSGGALKALQRYGQGMASQEFQNSYNRLSGVSTRGQNAAAGQGSASMQFGATQGANTRAAGDAMAAGEIGQGNAWSGALQSGVNQYQNNQIMKLFKPKSSYGSYGMDNHYFGNGTGGD